jgi:hypothetical protein
MELMSVPPLLLEYAVSETTCAYEEEIVDGAGCARYVRGTCAVQRISTAAVPPGAPRLAARRTGPCGPEHSVIRSNEMRGAREVGHRGASGDELDCLNVDRAPVAGLVFLRRRASTCARGSFSQVERRFAGIPVEVEPELGKSRGP